MTTPIEPLLEQEPADQLAHNQSAQNAFYAKHLKFLKLMEKQNLSPQVMNLVRIQRSFSEYLIYHSGCSLFDGLQDYTEASETKPQSLPDYLSFSPSLVEIISLVNFKDVSNCRLVSHRFHGAIQNNPIQMSRQMAHIVIEKEQSEPFSIVVSMSYRGKKKVRFLIRKDHVLMLHFDVPALSSTYSGFKEGMRLSTSSFEQGLRTALEPLLLRYNCNLDIFKSTTSYDDIPLEWFTAIAKLAKRSLSNCVFLDLPARSDLAAIPSILGSKSTNLLSPAHGISRTLLPFLQTKGCSRIHVKLTRFVQLKKLTEGVKELVEGWQRADYRIANLCFEYIAGDWPYDELCPYLRSLGMTDEYPRFNSTVFSITINRQSDKRVLCISHREREITMYDFVKRIQNKRKSETNKNR